MPARRGEISDRDENVNNKLEEAQKFAAEMQAEQDNSDGVKG